MKRIVRYFLYLLVFIFVVLAGLSITGIILEDKLVSMAVSQLNKNLTAKLDVKEVKVSLLSGFPYVSIIMNQVEIKEGSNNTSQNFDPGLFSFEKVTLKINLWQFINGNYNIDQLIFKNGWINLSFNNSGQSNFEVFKKSETSTSNWLLELDAIRLENVTISYIDLSSDWVVKGLIENATIKGKLSSNYQILTIKTTTRIGVVKQGAFQYLKDENLDLLATFRITTESFDFAQGEARLGNSRLNITGSLGRKVGSPINLKIIGSGLDSEQLLLFVSQYNLSIDPKTKIKGKISFSFSASGTNKMDQPFIFHLNYSSDRLVITLPGKPSIFVQKLSGSFTNGNLGALKSSELSIAFKELVTSESVCGGTLKVKNIESPLYHLKLSSNVNIADLALWGIASPFENGMFNGSFEVLGRLKNLENLQFSDFKNARIKANLDFKNLCASKLFSSETFQNISGTLKLTDYTLLLPNIKGLLNGSAFKASVLVENAPALIWKKGKAMLKTSISIDSLNTNWFFSTNDVSNKSSDSVWVNVESVSGDINIAHFKHNGFSSDPLSIDFAFYDKKFIFNRFDGKSCKGSYKGQLAATKIASNEYNLISNIDLNKIEISELFYSFSNFDQDFIKSTNISGDLSGSITFSTILKDWSLLIDSLESNSTLALGNGRLKDLEQMKSLGRFISLDELRDIHFESMENSILIENQTVSVPKMDIRSSAINLSVSGIHYFNGNYQYRVQLLLSDILFRKASQGKPENNEFGTIEEEDSGKTKLYLKVDGDTNDINVSYDGSAARQAFIQNLKTEKHALKEILSEEFSLLKKRDKKNQTVKDSICWSEDSLAKKESQKFTIEWDDN